MDAQFRGPDFSLRVQRSRRAPAVLRARLLSESLLLLRETPAGAPPDARDILAAEWLALAGQLAGSPGGDPTSAPLIRGAPPSTRTDTPGASRWFQKLTRSGLGRVLGASGLVREPARADAIAFEMVRCWGELPADVLPAVLEAMAPHLEHAAGALRSDPRARVQENLALALAHAGRASLAAHARALLDSPVPQARRHAAFALLTSAVAWRDAHAGSGAAFFDGWARRLWDAPSELDEARALTSSLPRERDATSLSRVLTELLRDPSPTRARTAALPALCLLEHADGQASRRRTIGTPGGAGAELAAALRDPESGAWSVLASALRFTRAPLSRLRAWQWAGTLDVINPRARSILAARLCKAWSVDDHEAVLPLSHLALRPARARAARGVIARVRTGAPSQGGALPDAAQTASLSAPARAGLARFSSAIRSDAPTRERVLAPLLTDSDALTRMSLVLHAPSALLEDLVFDADPAVARAALLRWSLDRTHVRKRAGEDAHARAAGDRALLERALRSPHARVRAAGERERILLTPRETDLRGALEGAQHDRQSLLRRCRAQLTSADPQQLMRALTIVRRMRLGEDLEPLLVRLVRARPPAGEWEKVSCTAASALSDSRTPGAGAALESALRDGTARLRSNALEGLARRVAAPGERAPAAPWIELKGDPHHRVRATALRLPLTHPDPQVSTGAALVEDLCAMLTHDNPAHRLAGAWAVSRVGVGGMRRTLGERGPEVAARVAELARCDAEPKVRVRAAACAAALDAGVRAAWCVPWQSKDAEVPDAASA